jgi:hypothetical protein
MSDTQVKVSPPLRWRRIALRVVTILLLAAAVGWTLNHISASMEPNVHRAGFGRGMMQGALMPMAMPNLLFGKDVNIYSTNNTGITYKLGYTAGVNTCGALFFGFFFWRVSRWRRNGKA